MPRVRSNRSSAFPGQATPHSGRAHHDEGASGGDAGQSRAHNRAATNTKKTVQNQSKNGTRSQIRTLLHDKLEWNMTDPSDLPFCLLICADDAVDQVSGEAEVLLYEHGKVKTDMLFLRENYRVNINDRPGWLCSNSMRVVEKYDLSAVNSKTRTLNCLGRMLKSAWCGIFFVPSYQIKIAERFIRSLNPKLDDKYVKTYTSRLVCLEDLLSVLPNRTSNQSNDFRMLWEMMREEEMESFDDYVSLTCSYFHMSIGRTPLPNTNPLSLSTLDLGWPHIPENSNPAPTPEVNASAQQRNYNRNHEGYDELCKGLSECW